MKIGEIKCQKCSKNPDQVTKNKAYLKRVNEKGVTGIYECEPSCSREFIATCPDCDSLLVFPRNEPEYCEDCGWPDEL